MVGMGSIMERNIQFDQKYYDYSFQLALQKEDMEVRCHESFLAVKLDRVAFLAQHRHTKKLFLMIRKLLAETAVG